MIDIIIEFWSQVTVILMVIFSFVKIVLDYFSKKREIRFSAINQNRIDTIKEYVNSYNNLHYTLAQFIYYITFHPYSDEKLQEHYSKVKVDFNSINNNTLLVNLFSSEDEAEIITNINNKFKEVVYL